jgi:hypothetical protein
MIGTVVLSLKSGMLTKLPRKVATRISVVVIGLKPTSSKAAPMTLMKIKPTAKTRIINRIANTKKL